MRTRRIAILIDGGYFLKRLPKLVDAGFCTTPAQVAESARYLCKKHALRLTQSGAEDENDGRWLDQVYQRFYYDAQPYTGKTHHPIENRPIDFDKSDTAQFRRELFAQLRRKRKFALRLGHVAQDGGWQIKSRHTKDLLKARKWADTLDALVRDPHNAPAMSETDQRELANLLDRWKALPPEAAYFGLRQKGVDMRIGLDISSIALKKHADTLILVTGDSDFVPAAKLARREGMEFIVDPLWQKVSDDLYEHVDGIISVYPRPARSEQ